jgi:hypothetical protein
MGIFDLPEKQQPAEQGGVPFAERFAKVIDDSMTKASKSREPRKYLGASRWGHHCDRALAYEFHLTPKDEGRDFRGQTLRIFDMGHDGEDRVSGYMGDAGFELTTVGPDGKQIGFEAADGRLKGHVDGIITGGPDLGVAYPCLWENKALGSKSYADVVRKGIKSSKPVYFVQAQVYMAYLGLRHCIFTCINRDTGELHAELIKADPLAAQQASDKALRIVQSEKPEEMPRCTTDRTDFRCKFCDFKEKCWSSGATPTTTQRPALGDFKLD